MKNRKKLKLETPAIDQIVVQGNIDLSYSPILSQFQINNEKFEGETDKTMLVGKVEDQATLSGILNTLYELHMPVLSVECIKQL